MFLARTASGWSQVSGRRQRHPGLRGDAAGPL